MILTVSVTLAAAADETSARSATRSVRHRLEKEGLGIPCASLVLERSSDDVQNRGCTGHDDADREQGDRGAAIYVDGIEERVIGARLVNGALRGGIQVAQDDDGDDERDDCSSDAEDDRLQIGDAVLVDEVLGHLQLEHEVVPGSDDAGCVDNSHAVPPPLEGRL